MTTQKNSVKKISMLNEIIDNAVELPLESQNLLLMMAKSMKYTRDCMIGEKMVNDPQSTRR